MDGGGKAHAVDKDSSDRACGSCRACGAAGRFVPPWMPCAAAKNIPVFFAHGDADDFVPVAMTRENYAACGAEKELFLAPGAGHGLSYLVERERCEAALLAFLQKHMHSA